MHKSPHAMEMLRLQKWLVGVLVLAFISSAAKAECPKLLMFDGVNIRTQTNVEQARYWGQSVGIEGFFVNNVMTDWQQDVGTDTANKVWRQLHQFETIYAKYGVSENFIKIAVYQPHDWYSSAQNDAVVRNFSHAAALAKYAGMKGVALDLEPYVPIWDEATNTADLAATVQQEGRMIAEAMYRAYPGMTLVVLPDVLENAQPEMTSMHMGMEQVKEWLGRDKPVGPVKYMLSVPFLRGLLSVPWAHVVIATEATYDSNSKNITPTLAQAESRYRNFASHEHLPVGAIGVAPGIWPLGRSYTDKSARETPASFEQRLKVALGDDSTFVWIYGFGSAWQANGPYGGVSGKGSGPVVDYFGDFTHAIKQAKRACKGSER